MRPIFPQSVHIKPLGQPFIDGSNSLSQGLVGWWMMNEGGGLTVYDRSGNNNDGAMTNMTVSDWVAGNHGGKALNFNGIDGYISLPTKNVDITKGTVSAWFQLNNSAFTGGLWQIYTTNSDRLVLYYFATSNAWELAIGSTISVVVSEVHTDVDNWHNVVLTYDTTNDKYEIYFDGILEDSSTTAFADQTLASTQEIGRYVFSGSGNEFHGLVDDFRIWNRVLNAREIQKLSQESYALSNRQSRLWFDSIGGFFESAFSLGIDGDFTILPGSMGEGTLAFNADQTFAILPGPIVEGSVAFNADQAFTDLPGAVGNALTQFSIIAIIDALPEAAVDGGFTLTETLSATFAVGVSFESIFSLGQSVTLSNGIQALPVAQITLSLTSDISDLAQAAAEAIAAFSWIGNVTILGNLIVATPSTRTFAVAAENRTFIVTE